MVAKSQERQKRDHARPRFFQVGDPVYVRNLSGSSSPQWLPGVVEGFSKLGAAGEDAGWEDLSLPR